MSTSRTGLNLFMETYLNTEPWNKEDYLLPIPWRQVTLPPKLKIAIIWSDGIVTPHPPIIRAMKEVANYLSKAGIELVDWKPEGHDECWEIASRVYYEDGGKYIENLILSGGEELLPLTKWIIKENKYVKYKTVEEVWEVSCPPSSPFLFLEMYLNGNIAQKLTQRLPRQILQPLAQHRLTRQPPRRRNPLSRRPWRSSSSRQRQILELHISMESPRIPRSSLSGHFCGSES
jgi:hypothetical protein